MHELSPTHNPTGTATELQNPRGTAEAVSSTNVISQGDLLVFLTQAWAGSALLSWGTPLNWVISAVGPDGYKSCQPMLMLCMPA